MKIPEEITKQARWDEEHKLFYERISYKCSCGHEYLIIPINDDIINCVCGQVIDSRLYSLSPSIRKYSQQRTT